jgi:hypothetical protein
MSTPNEPVGRTASPLLQANHLDFNSSLSNSKSMSREPSPSPFKPLFKENRAFETPVVREGGIFGFGGAASASSAVMGSCGGAGLHSDEELVMGVAENAEEQQHGVDDCNGLLASATSSSHSCASEDSLFDMLNEEIAEEEKRERYRGGGSGGGGGIGSLGGGGGAGRHYTHHSGGGTPNVVAPCYGTPALPGGGAGAVHNGTGGAGAGGAGSGSGGSGGVVPHGVASDTPDRVFETPSSSGGSSSVEHSMRSASGISSSSSGQHSLHMHRPPVSGRSSSSTYGSGYGSAVRPPRVSPPASAMSMDSLSESGVSMQSSDDASGHHHNHGNASPGGSFGQADDSEGEDASAIHPESTLQGEDDDDDEGEDEGGGRRNMSAVSFSLGGASFGVEEGGHQDSFSGGRSPPHTAPRAAAPPQQLRYSTPAFSGGSSGGGGGSAAAARVPPASGRGGGESQSPQEELPYGGDIGAAMRAHDRAAIRVIMQARLSPDSAAAAAAARAAAAAAPRSEESTDNVATPPASAGAAAATPEHYPDQIGQAEMMEQQTPPSDAAAGDDGHYNEDAAAPEHDAARAGMAAVSAGELVEGEAAEQEEGEQEEEEEEQPAEPPRDETPAERAQREMEESEALCRQLMEEEAMANYHRAHEAQMALLASPAARQGGGGGGGGAAVEEPDADLLFAMQMAEQEQEAVAAQQEAGAGGVVPEEGDADVDPDELDYDQLMELGARIGDVAQERWRLEAERWIGALPTTVWSGGESDEHKCSVCYCNYENSETLRTLPCGHQFHADCIDGWLADNPTCPMCKVSIKPEGAQLEGGGAAAPADVAAFSYE